MIDTAFQADAFQINAFQIYGASLWMPPVQEWVRPRDVDADLEWITNIQFCNMVYEVENVG